jgi:hypothetical protein
MAEIELFIIGEDKTPAMALADVMDYLLRVEEQVKESLASAKHRNSSDLEIAHIAGELYAIESLQTRFGLLITRTGEEET